ncbi:hypothetical protein CEXT_477061 [Caerostris extrusa]|uniref:Uncharacterized protein n=1 Tax=Caerostris extrusa TaxID=172846 RepID=A0AAV4XXA8_CAEEX|nr:hypothetical protein CEXT_477061 [Caerostris extrusa]
MDRLRSNDLVYICVLQCVVSPEGMVVDEQRRIPSKGRGGGYAAEMRSDCRNDMVSRSFGRTPVPANDREQNWEGN